MRPKFFQFTFLALSLVCIVACDSTGSDGRLYGCCDTPAISGTVGKVRIYIPNVFTPNGDNLNDLLFVYADTLVFIELFEIRDENSRAVYSLRNVPANDLEFGWDGIVNGKIKEGLYTVFCIVLALDGTRNTFEGKVCNFPCGLMDEEIWLPIENCQLASQIIHFNFDPSIPPGDSPGCFR